MREEFKKTDSLSFLLTLESQSQNITNWTESKDLREDFSYLLEMARSTLRSHESMRNCVLRLATQITHKFFEFGQPQMVSTLPTIFTSFLHKHEIHEFDHLIHNTFQMVEWKEQLKQIEQSYGTQTVDYNNLLYSNRGEKDKEKIGSQEAIHILKTERQNMSLQEKQNRLSELSRLYEQYAEDIVENHHGAIPEPNNETLQTKTQSVLKRAEQLKTPKYRIDDDHKRRQAIVRDGLQAVIDIFTEMRDTVLPEIPIKTDEQAYLWRDGFMDLANNFSPLGDDKHRMDFKGWAETLKNIELFGAEKGLKMSGSTITKETLDMIDESTLPLKYYPQYQMHGVSYISKEHLDSKGVIIANCFIDMMNRVGGLWVAADMFSEYLAKIRGVRALAVSSKLSTNK